jgi:hypothetical protein
MIVVQALGIDQNRVVLLGYDALIQLDWTSCRQKTISDYADQSDPLVVSKGYWDRKRSYLENGQFRRVAYSRKTQLTILAA